MQALTMDGVRKGSAGLAARVAAGSALATVLLLALLHVVSPEFDPSWRVVSEYANGDYGWVLSLMFVTWALSSWATAVAIRPEVTTSTGKIGFWLLIVAGVGESIAAAFDINHPLHGMAGLLGVPTMAAAALLISRNITCAGSYEKAGKLLRLTSNMIWVSLLLFVVTMVVLIVSRHYATSQFGTLLNRLPHRAIALNGWANRLYVVSCSIWSMSVAKSVLNKIAP